MIKNKQASKYLTANWVDHGPVVNKQVSLG